MSCLSGILPSASTRHSALSVLCLPVHPTYMLPSSSKAASDLHNHVPCTRKFPSVTSLPQLVPCPLKKQDARTNYPVPPPLPGSQSAWPFWSYKVRGESWLGNASGYTQNPWEPCLSCLCLVSAPYQGHQGPPYPESRGLEQCERS